MATQTRAAATSRRTSHPLEHLQQQGFFSSRRRAGGLGGRDFTDLGVESSEESHALAPLRSLIAVSECSSSDHDWTTQQGMELTNQFN